MYLKVLLQNAISHVLTVCVPGVALILWVCGGVVALCCSLTSAELALTYPTAGARYDYLRIFYGDLAGFIHMWEYIFITRPGSNAIKCFIAAQ